MPNGMDRPCQSINGSALRTTYGLSTREKEAAEMTGTDFEENIEQLKIEKTMIENAGLTMGNPAVLAGKDSGEGGDE